MLFQNKWTQLSKILHRPYMYFLNQACTKIGNKSDNTRRVFKVWRYGGADSNEKPRYVNYELNIAGMNMILDVMIRIKEIDPTFTFRRSCREGICGSCGINIQGYNTLACTELIPKDKIIIIRPLPHMYVLKDLVVDMSHFYNGYKSIRPYLIRKDGMPKFGSSQYAQTTNERRELEGLYECILCACCSTACPSYWWNGRRFLGPAALLSAYRWIIDSRDGDTNRRLYNLRDDFKVFRCHTIMNCSQACPKELNPALAIAKLKKMIVGVKRKPKPKVDPLKYANEKVDQRTKSTC